MANPAAEGPQGPSKRKPVVGAVLAVVVLVLTAGGCLFAWKLHHTAQETQGLQKPTVDASIPSALPSVALPDLKHPQVGGEGVQFPMEKGEAPTYKYGPNIGGTNIVIAGNAEEHKDHGGASLTDSIMVLHIDEAKGRSVLVSIPRDTWVYYGGYWGKINALYPSYGFPALASEVSTITGLQAKDTVLMNWTGLQQFVDAVGGVEVTIAAQDSRGINDPNAHLRITNGKHHIDGKTALALSRARNDPPSGGNSGTPYGLPNGDFDRQANQRMVAQALVKKLQSSSTFLNPVTSYKVLTAVGDNVKTSMNTTELVEAAQALSKTPELETVSFRDLLDDYRSSNGQLALVPAAGKGDYSQLRAAVAQAVNG